MNPSAGVPTNDFTKISEKLHEIENNLGVGGASLRSANGMDVWVKTANSLKSELEVPLLVFVGSYIY